MNPRASRRAYTLIELLVVIAIIAFLAGLTALYFPSFQDREFVRRGSDRLQATLLIAKQQAKRDGRPTGIRLTVNTAGFCTQIQYIQQPDDYARGTYTGTTGTPPVASFSLPKGVAFNAPITLPGASETLTVQPGDYLEIYGGGLLHRIGKVGPSALELEGTTSPTSSPSGTSAAPAGVNYRLILQPRLMAGEQPILFPTRVAIDLNPHPLNGNKSLCQAVPIRGAFYEVLFAPSGAVVGQGTSSAQIIFWLRDVLEDNSADLLVGSATLITVQPRSGFIASHPVASGADPYLFTKDARSSGL